MVQQLEALHRLALQLGPLEVIVNSALMQNSPLVENSALEKTQDGKEAVNLDTTRGLEMNTQHTDVVARKASSGQNVSVDLDNVVAIVK
ncbi:hypothetical protein R1flu_022239 [Riccia fluitans]|uniref:Uncharacterized protein n=1 Tax=Riccia fluitans TaxID=41844 RepID=A0ABD1ZSY5_9MARC